MGNTTTFPVKINESALVILLALLNIKKNGDILECMSPFDDVLLNISFSV